VSRASSDPEPSGFIEPRPMTVRDLADATGVGFENVLDWIQARALDGFILAEPLKRKELLFHEATWALAELLNELRAYYADDTETLTSEGRSIVEAIKPKLIDMWLRARTGNALDVSAVISKPDGSSKTVPLQFVGRALRRVQAPVSVSH
jgi:hypothetical protein